tara:strand:+ start:10243 stop:10881 length:639 start_codon:yes stop_codon:yes gene_type:complete
MYEFLAALGQNNSKDWMDTNRKQYHRVRDFYIAWLDTMNQELAGIDKDYFDTPGKKAINRINNNLMFQPLKPVYKNHFGAGLDQITKQGDFYIQIGIEENFIGGGYWHPSSKVLKSIREAIDYNGQELTAILNKKSFKKTFGDLVPGECLKNAPKGFHKNHQYIKLLKRKSFAAGKTFTKQEVLAPDFNQRVIALYMELLPFRRYLNNAVTV